MTEQPLIPVRMLNEYVYCPRLAHLMWVQAEFAHNEFTTDGVIKHKQDSLHAYDTVSDARQSIME